jgi:hypothetical protein
MSRKAKWLVPFAGPRHGLRFSVGEQSCVKVVAAGDGTKISYYDKNETKSRALRHCLDGAARRLGAVDPDVAGFVHHTQKDTGI